MRIGEVARATGLTPGTIRYYERIGLVPEPRRTPSAYRDYDEDAVERLHFVTDARALGLSLEEIGDVLAASGPGQVCCEHVVRLLEAQRDRIEEWMRTAATLRDVLTRTIEEGVSEPGRRSALADCPVVRRGLHERALLAVEDIGLRGSLPRPVGPREAERPAHPSPR